jgi:hypothetical protein
MINKKTLLEKFRMIEVIEENPVKAIELQFTQKDTEVIKFPSSNKQDDNLKPNKLLSIHEIYKNVGLTCSGNNTIYIVDSFSKALPENLPASVKRQSVINLLCASGIDSENILTDGKYRLQALNDFLQNSLSSADESIFKSESEIKKLTEKINEYKHIINERKKLKQEQKSIIEYETQKIQNTILFIEEK